MYVSPQKRGLMQHLESALGELMQHFAKCIGGIHATLAKTHTQGFHPKP